jgi:excisionase family DNA binding protein
MLMRQRTIKEPRGVKVATRPKILATPEELRQDILTVTEAAAALNLPRASIYYFCRTGVIPAVRHGGRIRVPRSSIETLQAKRAVIEPIPAFEPADRKPRVTRGDLEMRQSATGDFGEIAVRDLLTRIARAITVVLEA